MANNDKKTMDCLDGNEAAAAVAYALSEIIAIYPITPSSNMGEFSDGWSAEGKKNIFGTVPQVIELQSEGGASGTVHGALTTGALTTTFTSSQGLLLMIPNMFKIAGELTPTVFHIAARAVSCQGLSIFGDHSDVMACRATGYGMLCSNSVQEAHDFAAIATAATLKSRIPFLHFFDGFRISHEVHKIAMLSDEQLRGLMDPADIAAFRKLGMDPERPVMRGTAQNPDVFFQARETVNPFYDRTGAAVQKVMDRFAELTGRSYKLFEYYGAPDAARLIVMMGSGTGAAEEAVDALNAKGGKVGLLKVRLYRPFEPKLLLEAIPATVRAIAVLDRTKEPGSQGEPLFVDFTSALAEYTGDGGNRFGGKLPKVIGGRYGLSSKEFTPAMVKAVYDELSDSKPKPRFTVGINDDVTGLSLKYDPAFSTEHKDTFRGIFYGLGADGTVGANKNSIKIIAEGTELHAQGYFVYDSKKSGSITISHLRFGPQPIRSTYLISQANFVAVHQEVFLEKFDVLERAMPGATFLLNTTTPADQAWDSLPRETQEGLIAKKCRFYVIDAYKVAKDAGLGGRINTVMQVCYFSLAKIVPDAIDQIKAAIKYTYGKKSQEIVDMNFKAVDNSLAFLKEVPLGKATSTKTRPPVVSSEAPEFVRKVTAEIIAGRGDQLPVSALPVDGTYPLSTTRWEKRNIAQEIPVWDNRWCIQCAKCSLVCPHASIRTKTYAEGALQGAPKEFQSVPYKGKEFAAGTRYSVQVAPEDCTGCGICVEACPGKNKEDAGKKAINMAEQAPLRLSERACFSFFDDLPQAESQDLNLATVKGSQLRTPLFEFSGACGGCGETPYVKLVSQLFGDRLAVANATGCSSIYGGNLPTTPWAVRKDGKGPVWSNSLFEDNAEFGLGFRLAYDKKREFAGEILKRLAGRVGDTLVKGILETDQKTDAGIAAVRAHVVELKKKLAGLKEPEAAALQELADSFVRKSVWIMGGDGWAYDIGYGGLDHVLASGRDVNILVLDTEVYSNTGGQASKATPRGAVAKFAASGKKLSRKDLAMLAVSYGSVYVARVAFGASDAQTVKAMVEAESYPGTSIIIAYSHCIAHGFDLKNGLAQQKAAVDSGYWPLFRYDPRRADKGENPMQLDSKGPKIPLADYAYKETRYRMLTKSNPEEAKRLMVLAQADVERRWKSLEAMATVAPKPAAAVPQNPVNA